MRSRLRDPLPSRLTDALRSYQPTGLWDQQDGAGALSDLTGRWPATVTGSPTYRVAAPDPIGWGITWSGTGMYASTATSFPTPSASISVLSLVSTTNATAAARYIASRAAASQWSWGLDLAATHVGRFSVFQAAGAIHATASTAGAINDGNWWLVAGTFDGTTVSFHRVSSTGVYGGGSNGSLTGSWHKASTAAVQLSAGNSTNLLPGTSSRTVVINDRILTAADVRYIASIVRGG
jgi:hypothetical protein